MWPPCKEFWWRLTNLTPVLSGAIGEHREVDPPAALERHFQCLWSNTVQRHMATPLAVVPDGYVDITWIEGELIVAGPDVTVALSTLKPGSTATPPPSNVTFTP